jgi:hypothetical protein
MGEFLWGLLVDELIGLLPKPLRIVLWSVLGAAIAILLVWLMLR